jgi:hypothetical protein
MLVKKGDNTVKCHIVSMYIIEKMSVGAKVYSTHAVGGYWNGSYCSYSLVH